MPRDLFKETGMSYEVPRDLFMETEEPKEPEAPEERGWIKPSLEELGMNLVGGAEAAMALSSSAMLFTPGVLYGAASLPRGEEAARLAEESIQSLAYQPYTEKGKLATEAVAKPIEWLLKPAKKAGELAGGGKLGYATEKAGELLTFGLLPKAKAKIAKAVTKKPKAPVFAEPEKAPFTTRSGGRLVESTGPTKPPSVVKPSKIIEQPRDLFKETEQPRDLIKEVKPKAKEPWEMTKGEYLKETTKRPEREGYAEGVLSLKGLGKPKITVEPRITKFGDEGIDITYRNPEGLPIALARLTRDSKGELFIDDFVQRKKSGLLGGKAVASIGKELEKLKAVKPLDAKISPDAAKLYHHYQVKQAQKQGKSIPPAVQAEYPGLFPKKPKATVEDLREVKLGKKPTTPPAGDTSYISNWAASGKGIDPKSIGGELLDSFYTIKTSKKTGKPIKVRAKGFPFGLLKKGGRHVDEMIASARNDGFNFPEDAMGDDLVRAIVQDVNAKLSGDEVGRVRTQVGLEKQIDIEVKEYYAAKEKEVIEKYGKDFENNPEYWKELEEGTLFEDTESLQANLKREVVEEVGRERGVPRKSIDEINSLFDEAVKEPTFELKPTEPTIPEKIAIAKSKGEMKAPEKGIKPRAVIPTEKIKPPTTGKQASLLPPEKGETLDLFETAKPRPKGEVKRVKSGPHTFAIFKDGEIRIFKGSEIVKNPSEKLMTEAEAALGKKGKFFVTLESGGFQTVYEFLVDRLKRVKPVRPKTDIKVYDTGKIVKQRTWKRKAQQWETEQKALFKGGKELTGQKVIMKAPPVYEAELAAMKKMPELRRRPLGGWIENPIRTFEDLGGDVKEIWYRTIKEGEHHVALENKAINKWVKDLKKGLSFRSRKRIGVYAMSRQARGKEILKSMGITKYPTLKGKEVTVYNSLRRKFNEFYDRLNQARKLSGKDPFPKVKNYFTFIRDLSTLEEMGFNPVLTPSQTINQKFIHMKTTPFRFAKARAKFGTYPAELDAFHIFEKYSAPAVKHIHVSPRVAKLRELMLTFTDPKTKAKWRLRDEKPHAAKFLTEWLDFQAGQKPPTAIPAPIEKLIMKLNRNLTYAILSGNLRSALIQPTAIRGTYVEIGPLYTWKGIESLLHPEKRNFAMKKSNVLLSRDYDVAVQDAIRFVRAGKIGEVKKAIAKKGLKPLQLLDMETAKATWQGGYQYALEKLNYAEKKAVNFADDLVTKTQASASPSDIAPIQRTAMGKALSLFQTFVINEWGWLTKDVLGIKNARVTNKTAFKKVARLLAATTLINIFYEDVLGVNSPYSTPIKAFQKALDDSDDFPSASLEAAKELAETVPIVGGGLRYKSSPLGALAELASEGIKKPTLETAGKLMGVPGTAQIGKTIRAKKRGESGYGQIVGQYTGPKKGLGRLRSRRLKSLKGL